MAIFNEAYISEYQMLNEMHFSKKDLQDPATIDRILKSKEIFENVLKFVDWLLFAIDIAVGVLVEILIKKYNKSVDKGSRVSGGILVSATVSGLIGILFVKLSSALRSLPAKQYAKNIEKFKTKINNLISKMEENIQKDPENKDKYQEVIDNCKKVLKELEDREKYDAKLKLESKVDDLKEMYDSLKSWRDHPDTIGHTANGMYFDMFELARVYDIPEMDLVNHVIHNMKEYSPSDIDMIFGYDYDDNKIVDEFEKKKYIWFWVSSDDEYNTFIIENNKKMYATADCRKYEPTSFYKESGGSKKLSLKDEALIEFDKEMGFYKFSSCPENVKKKEFISFR